MGGKVSKGVKVASTAVDVASTGYDLGKSIYNRFAIEEGSNDPMRTDSMI